ncbi:CynX/NimT family MFS transporter [Chloroflexota bacterium]
MPTSPMHRKSHPILMLAFAFLIAFLLHLLLFSTAPMVSVIMEEMGLSYTEFGLVFSVAMISLILFRIPWGLVGDRLGYLNALRIALPISAISAVLRALTSGYVPFLVGQFILGVGLASVLPCLPLMIKEWTPKNVGLGTGIYVSGFAAGNATALALTPHLIEVLAWRNVLLVYGGFAALVSLLWWALAKSTIRITPSFRLDNFTNIIRDKYVWILLLLMAAAMGSYDTLATWLPKVLELKNINPVYASLLALGFFLAGPVVGFFLDRFWNKSIILMLLGTIASISIAGINYAPFPLLGMLIVLSGFMLIGVLTISLTVPTEHKRFSKSVATVVGVTSSLSNFGPFLIPIVFGFLMDITGSHYASIFAVAIFAGFSFILGSRVIDLKH